MTMNEALAWSLLVIGAGMTFACSAAEIAGYSVNRVRLGLRVAKREPRALGLDRELAKPGRMLATLILVTNAAGYLLAEGVSRLMEPAPGTTPSPWREVLLDIAIITPIMLIVGEALPKELARVEADRLAYVFAGPLSWSRTLLTWLGILPLVMWASRTGERWAGLAKAPGDPTLADARQRIAVLLREGVSAGGLSASQSGLVDRALALKTVRVRDEMIPWDAVRTIDAASDRASALRQIGNSPHSRFPLVDRRGRVVGVLRQIDMYVRTGERPDALSQRPAILAPDMPVVEAITRVVASPARVGIVEHQGRPIGLVTAKDLFEPLTGELPDW